MAPYKSVVHFHTDAEKNDDTLLTEVVD